MKNSQNKSGLQTTIHSLSPEGYGIGEVAYPEGQQSTAIVPFTMPGDTASVSLLGKKKGIYQARLENVIQASPERHEPRCIHFGSCGGCRWQHIPYEQQLKQKEDAVRNYLKPYLSESVSFYPILACDPPWYYRNKMEFSFSSDKAKNNYLGLILNQSRGHVFNLTECHLTHPWFSEAVKVVREWWEACGLEAYYPGHNTGSLRTLIVREGQRTGDRMIVLTVSGNPDYALHESQIKAFVERLRQAIEPANAEHQLSIFVRVQQVAKGMRTNFYEMLVYGPDHIREILYIKPFKESITQEMAFKISLSAFFQPNTRQAEQLYSRALQLADIPEDAIVYDLYCGTGTLGICAAKRAKKVIGVELSPEAVLDAKENIKLNGVSNVTIHAGDVGDVLEDLSKKEEERPSVVMVDPPRAGLDPKALAHLIRLNAPKILYISCNPLTQAVNLEGLLNAGYRLEAVQPVDQFPQTIHIENIVILTR